MFKKGERAGLSGKGIYFSPYQQNLYGRNSMPVYLKIENPMTKAPCCLKQGAFNGVFRRGNNPPVLPGEDKSFSKEKGASFKQAQKC